MSLYAREAARLCSFGMDKGTVEPPGRAAGITAALAKCRGDLSQQRASWQEMLAFSDQRLSLARAAMPTDVVLARFAAQRYPDRADVLIWLGDGLKYSGANEAAINAYEHGLALDAGYALTWLTLGRLYEAQGDWQAALNAFDEACFRNDRGGNGCKNAGRLYLAHEMYDLAEDRFRLNLVQIPGFTSTQRGLADALLAQGKTAEAVPYLRDLAEKGDEAAAQRLQELSASN